MCMRAQTYACKPVPVNVGLFVGEAECNSFFSQTVQGIPDSR